MIHLVVATFNAGKVREIAAALVPAGIEVVGLEALADRSPVEETGTTFEENARQKAEGYSRRTELPVLAEDSGIEVDALGGEPGVYSARYGGEGLGDAERNRRLLDALDGVETARRTARFHSVIAIALRGETLATFDGVVEGRVLEEPRGSGGFGYDPIFLHAEAGCFGELTTAEKQRWSHRGQALRALTDAIRVGDSRLAALADRAASRR